MGEHQTNNSAIFFHTALFGKYSTAYGKYSTVGFMRNIFESLKVAKTNDLSTRNALNQLKHHHNMIK